MNIRKITAAVIAVTILAGMTACSDTANETAEVSETTTIAETTTVEEETTTTTAETTVTEETTTTSETEAETTTTVTEEPADIEYSSTYEEIDSAAAEKLDEHGVLNAVKAHLAYALSEASGDSGTRVEYGFAAYLGYAETAAGAYGLVVREPEKEDMPTRIDVIDIKSINQYGAPLFATAILEIPVEEVIEQGYIPDVYFYEGGSGDSEKYWYQNENGYMAMAEVGDSVPLDYTIELIEIDPIDITAEGYPCYECESCKAGEYVCDAPIDLQYK